MKKPMILVGSLLFVIIALSVVRITLVNSISTTGIELVDLQNQIAKYNNDNELLQEKYLQAASYTTISAQAKKLGFVPQKSEIDMIAPLPLALKQ